MSWLSQNWMNGTLCCCFFFQQKLRSIRCNQWASEKCIFWCGKQSNAIEYIKWSFVHLYSPFSIQKSSYLLCENHPLDAHAHTHWAIVLARNRATARTHNCSVQYFFSRFHSLPQSIESVQRLNHMCVRGCIPVIQTIFVCLFANFKLASVQYNINISVAFEYNYQNHNKNHDLSIFLCGWFFHSHSHFQ